YNDSAVIKQKITVDGLKGTDEITAVTLDGEATDAGVYEGRIAVTGIAIGEDGNANDNYTISYEPGTLTIEQRELILTSASAEKVYDGTPLTKDEVKVGGDGLADGETIAFDVTGSQTDVGSSPNTFTYTISKAETKTAFEKVMSPFIDTAYAAGSDDALEKNYDITEVYGTLTVTAANEPADDGSGDKDSSESKTGDDTNLLGLLGAMAAALAGLIALATVRRREE
ncbi:MAG: MBG domain-containing protein, partial [Bacillota bacterium]